jgi:hypothetical protein
MTSPSMVGVNDTIYDVFLEQEALMSLSKALLITDDTSETDRARVDALMQQAEQERRSPLGIVFDENQTLNTQLASFFLFGFIRFYKEYIAAAPDIQSATTFFYHLDEVWEEDDSPHVFLVRKVLDGLEALTIFSKQVEKTDASYIKIATIFHAIALEFERLKNEELCLNNLLTGINFSRKKDLHLSKKMMAHCISLAKKNAGTDLSIHLLQFAVLNCEIADNDQSQQVHGFDATAQLLRYILTKKQVEGIEPSAEINKQIRHLIKDHGYLKTLGVTYLAGMGLLPNAQNLPDISATYTAIRKDSLTEWSHDFFNESRNIIFEIANERFRLFHQSVKKSIQVRFNDWSIQHQNLLQAIPHNRSVLKEEYLSDLLMELKHELIHVHSLFGSVGATLSVMRWCLAEVELTLFLQQGKFTNYEKDISLANSRLQSSREPVKLLNPDAVLLLHAERSVTIEQKIKIIENIWTPWFEGIAVFGEISDDPLLDAEIESLPSTVIKHLADLIVSTDELEEKSREELVADHIKEMETAYHESIKEKAPDRLRNYLTRNYRKYLPGYFCARKLLSSWRKTYHDKTLRGDQAARLLLHLTRFSGFDTVPDISLPVDEFRHEAMKKHIEWLNAIKALTYKEIDAFASQDRSNIFDSYSWENGTFKKAELKPEEIESDVVEKILAKGKECLKYILDEETLEKKVAQSDSKVKETLKEAIGSIESNPFLLINKKFAFLLGGRYTVLPLAQAECPFWMIDDGKRLNVLIRTREKDKEHREPRYNVVSLPLTDDEYDSLREIVCATGAPNITVTRSVVLGGTKSPHLTGTHYFVYQCEKWMHVSSAGMFFGGTPEDDVTAMLEYRLAPNEFIEYKEAINSDDHPLASRTLQWIKDHKWHYFTDDFTMVDLASWAGEISQKCEAVLSKETDDIDAMSLLIYEFIFNDKELAKKLCNDGIGPLRDSTDFTLTDKFIEFLIRSALEPVQTASDTALAGEVNKLFPTMLANTKNGWDFI